jgi:hypothetical protein
MSRLPSSGAKSPRTKSADIGGGGAISIAGDVGRARTSTTGCLIGRTWAVTASSIDAGRLDRSSLIVAGTPRRGIGTRPASGAGGGTARGRDDSDGGRMGGATTPRGAVATVWASSSTRAAGRGGDGRTTVAACSAESSRGTVIVGYSAEPEAARCTSSDKSPMCDGASVVGSGTPMRSDPAGASAPLVPNAGGGPSRFTAEISLGPRSSVAMSGGSSGKPANASVNSGMSPSRRKLRPVRDTRSSGCSRPSRIHARSVIRSGAVNSRSSVVRICHGCSRFASGAASTRKTLLHTEHRTLAPSVPT